MKKIRDKQYTHLTSMKNQKNKDLAAVNRLENTYSQF